MICFAQLSLYSALAWLCRRPLFIPLLSLVVRVTCTVRSHPIDKSLSYYRSLCHWYGCWITQYGCTNLQVGDMSI